ncbi:MAG TPA: MerR family transcriptional regulator [Firmicutes bacterium]|nr:MerR family transcriptional regulator [Bacillales bacterium]HJA41581.1 MerR family transcriptional regulator [Bacillota bacterium]
MNHHLNNCFTTGEFAKACNITKQTLFHYDAIGLLTPHFKDEKGYRYYSYQQFDLLYVINILKELGMSLKEIKQFIKTNSPERMIALFQSKSDELTQKIETLKQIQKVIETRIHLTEQATQLDFSKIYTEYHETEYLFLSDRIPDYSNYQFVRSVSEFITISTEKKLNVGYPIGAMLHREKLLGQQYGNYTYLYLKIEEGQNHVPRYEKKAGLYVIGYHIGEEDTIGKTYDQILQYMKNNHLEIQDFAYEEFILDSISVTHTDAYVTKIVIPVYKH